MAKIPLPDRGQPIDVTYLYKIVDSLNELSNQISPATYNYTTISTRDAGPQVVQTRGAKIIGGYVDISSSDVVAPGDTKPWSFTYTSDFKYPPIVTATVVNPGVSDVGDDVSVIIRFATTSRVEGVVRFNSGGLATTTINLLAIGIPT